MQKSEKIIDFHIIKALKGQSREKVGELGVWDVSLGPD
jgi:hypothetical protein